MSTRIVNNVMERHNKVPFHSLVNDDDENLMRVEEQSIGHAQETPKIKNMVDRLVGNLRKQHRYVDDHPKYKHERLIPVKEGEAYYGSEGDGLQRSDRSSSLDEMGDLCRFTGGERGDIGEENSCSPALHGRRRSRSDSDLMACAIFARRRAAICEEMERNIFMENGATLRKCRKNLVLNQILENLSLL